MAHIARGLKNIVQKHPNDLVSHSALRTTSLVHTGVATAMPTPSKCSQPASVPQVLKATLTRNPNLPSSIQDVAVGTFLSELGGSKAARMILNYVGYPLLHKPLHPITTIADLIALCRNDIGIAAGIEPMTCNYGSKAVPTALSPDLRESPAKDARDCIMSIGLTSQNAASRDSVSRSDQDAFTIESDRKASLAQRQGLFDEEIVPVTVSSPPEAATPPIPTTPHPQQTPSPSNITADEGIRPSTTQVSLAKLNPPAFSETGTSAASISSQISDGAIALLLNRRSIASSLSLNPSIMGNTSPQQTSVCPSSIMGVGPAVAIPQLLAKTVNQEGGCQYLELNEGFYDSSFVLYSGVGVGWWGDDEWRG
ncbi:MAG: hypothetical protein LQ343_002187 [Gyalolechia ehrenbergii]|nr:MAG: hypothetical protein LQ343_002187 [Gyalolechia ehrenbergii]